jgi:hypothetical protein
MAPINNEEVSALISNGAFRVLPYGKQLTLALGDLYIVSTTLSAKAQLVWETEKSYPRYYIPVASLHSDVHAIVQGDVAASGISIKAVNTTIDKTKAVAEQLSVGSKSTNWVRFVDGPLKELIRIEKEDFGELRSSNLPPRVNKQCAWKKEFLKMERFLLASRTHSNESIPQQCHTTL